jgi:hypothetical protein
MNSLLKLWTALIKDAGFKYAETNGILSDQHDGFRKHRNIHDALCSIIMMMEDAKLYHKDFYVMYADFEGAFNALTTASCPNTYANSVCPPPLLTHANTSTMSLPPTTLPRTAPSPPST